MNPKFLGWVFFQSEPRVITAFLNFETCCFHWFDPVTVTVTGFEKNTFQWGWAVRVSHARELGTGPGVDDSQRLIFFGTDRVEMASTW